VADVTVFTGLPNNRGPAIVRSTNGTLLAFCNGIYLKRSADNGATWGPLITVGATGNPVPVVDETTGRIHLLTSNSYYTYSDDDGLTWSPPVDYSSLKLPGWDAINALGPGHGIQLQRGAQAGRLVLPAWHGGTLDGVHLVCSDDHGTNWYIGAVREHVGNGRRPTENQVVERVGLSATNSRLYCNARDSGTALGNRSDNYSNDGGLSYGPSFNALNPALVEPGCQGSVQRQRATDEGAAYDAIVLSLPNHDYVGSDAASRWNMSIWYSVDEGGSWSDPISIYPGSTGYSDMTRFPNGDIGLLYEADYYSKINFTLVTPASLGLPANATRRRRGMAAAVPAPPGARRPTWMATCCPRMTAR